jgi:hypothetical protein
MEGKFFCSAYPWILAPAVHYAVLRERTRKVLAATHLHKLAVGWQRDATGERTPALERLVFQQTARVEVSAADLVKETTRRALGRARSPALDRLVHTDPTAVEPPRAHLNELALHHDVPYQLPRPSNLGKGRKYPWSSRLPAEIASPAVDAAGDVAHGRVDCARVVDARGHGSLVDIQRCDGHERVRGHRSAWRLRHRQQQE